MKATPASAAALYAAVLSAKTKRHDGYVLLFQCSRAVALKVPCIFAHVATLPVIINSCTSLPLWCQLATW
jgi:hypothetical protein